jgi:hypothetical protein
MAPTQLQQNMTLALRAEDGVHSVRQLARYLAPRGCKEARYLHEQLQTGSQISEFSWYMCASMLSQAVLELQQRVDALEAELETE